MDREINKYFPSYYKKQYNKIVTNDILKNNFLCRDLNRVVLDYLVGNIYYEALLDDLKLIILDYNDTFKFKYHPQPPFNQYINLYFKSFNNKKEYSRTIFTQNNRRKGIVLNLKMQLQNNNPHVEKYRNKIVDIEKV